MYFSEISKDIKKVIEIETLYIEEIKDLRKSIEFMLR